MAKRAATKETKKAAFVPTERQRATLAMIARVGAVAIGEATTANIRNHYAKLVQAGALVGTPVEKHGLRYTRYTLPGGA